MLPKKRTMYFKASLDVSVDLKKIWDSINFYKRVNLGGEDGKYTVYFTGTMEDGLKVLETLVNSGDLSIQMTIGY